MNLCLVLASQMMGHTQLGLFCATMDLPHQVYKNSYQKMQKKLSINAESLAEKAMVDAAERLFQVTKKEKPGKHSYYRIWRTISCFSYG